MAHLCFGLILILLTNLQKLLSESYVFRSIYEIVYFKNMYINMLNLMASNFSKIRNVKDLNVINYLFHPIVTCNCNLIDTIIHIG